MELIQILEKVGAADARWIAANAQDAKTTMYIRAVFWLSGGESQASPIPACVTVVY